jgi:hypothetical protein
MSKLESNSTPVLRGDGWFKASRHSDARELARRAPSAFILAWFIADRARFKDSFSAEGLMPGEAMLGDFRQYGFSARSYRTAKQNLEKWGFATFKATPRGTVGKLTDTRLFNPSNTEGDNQTANLATNERQTDDNQTTTNKNGKNVKNGKNDSLTQAPSADETEIDREVEPPLGFPKDEQEAKAQAALAGVDQEFAVTTYHNAVGRGYRDARGVTIRKFSSYLKAMQGYSKSNQAERDRNANNNRGAGAATKPNHRNAGICTSPATDYSTAKPKFQRQREEAERLARQVAADGHNPPATESGPQ